MESKIPGSFTGEWFKLLWISLDLFDDLKPKMDEFLLKRKIMEDCPS
jgi:hypothetical protein